MAQANCLALTLAHRLPTQSSAPHVRACTNLFVRPCAVPRGKDYLRTAQGACVQPQVTGELRGSSIACRAASADPVANATTTATGSEIKVTTFNVLAPIYKRVGSDGDREADEEGKWVERNAEILKLLIEEACSDVVCIQEFWHASGTLQKQYEAAFKAAGYELFVTPRTNDRGDGLLTAVRTDRVKVVERRHVPFNDCGDRVAQVLWLQPPGDGEELLLVNTHLLFPHNSNSTLIRLREAFKLLEFLDWYKKERQLAPMPIVMCGDWNGTKNGRVYKFMKSQGFVSSLEESFSTSACDGPNCWISHRNHHGQNVGVDYIWLLNPSVQHDSLTADWRAAVFTMIEAKLLDIGADTTQKAFALFDANKNGTLDREEFRKGIAALGMQGEGSIGLLDHEIEELHMRLDGDGNDVIDLEEFARWLDVETMSAAYARIRDTNGIWEGDWEYSADLSTVSAAPTCPLPPVGGHALVAGDLEVIQASLDETALHSGEWPEGFDLSDHLPLTSVLRFKQHADE